MEYAEGLPRDVLARNCDTMNLSAEFANVLSYKLPRLISQGMSFWYPDLMYC